MLVDAKNSSSSSKQWVALVVGNELFRINKHDFKTTHVNIFEKILILNTRARVGSSVVWKFGK